jgi:hypothetical protein
MRKQFAIALVSLAALGLTSRPASAWWFPCCKSKCCMTLCAKQYNAFSPYCLDSLNGCFPLQGNAANGGCFLGCPTGFSAHAGVACLGELPQGLAGNATVINGSTQVAPTISGPNGSAAVVAPGQNGWFWPNPLPSAPMPNGTPSYFPVFTGPTNTPGR